MHAYLLIVAQVGTFSLDIHLSGADTLDRSTQHQISCNTIEPYGASLLRSVAEASRLLS